MSPSRLESRQAEKSLPSYQLGDSRNGFRNETQFVVGESALNHLQTQQQIWRTAQVLGVTLIAVSLLIAIAFKLRSWYRGDSEDAADSDQLMLQFRDLHRQGGLSEDEYRSIKGRLTSRQPTDSSAVGRETEDQARTPDDESAREPS